MKLRRVVLALLVSSTVVACSTVDVTTDFDHSAAFGSYRTYSLVEGPSAAKLATYTQATLRNVVRSELAKRGITEADRPDADLAIVWRVFRADQTSARELAEERSGGRWDYAYGAYTSWSGAPANFSNATRYPDGTLVLDVVDIRAKRLVFRGTATATVIGPEQGGRNVEKAVRKMIAALPAPR